jgi:hypothetical protein
MMDGLRGHYAQRYGDDRSAAFTSVSLLSTLFIANVSGVILLTDELLHGGRVTLGSWIHVNRAAVLVFAILVLASHSIFAKRSGVYDRHGPPSPATWRHRFRVYVWFTVCIFFLPVVVALARRILEG